MTHRNSWSLLRRIYRIAVLAPLAAAVIFLLIRTARPSLLHGQLLRPTATAPSQVDFSQVEPVFKEHCQSCHGTDIQMGGLRLDRREDALRGGKSGAVILPGNSAGSR